jgi:1-acyl-sn-glycerol-3-phosphate acyltransferase
MGKIIGFFRLIIFLSLVLIYLGRYIVVSLFRGRELSRGLKLRTEFSKILRYPLGVKPEITGKPIDKPAIYVGNHRSYYDPGVVAIDLMKVVVVARAEIKDWPLIGYAVDFTGIIFVQRSNQDSRKATREAMAKAIQDGYSVLIYPEGTTGDRPTTLAFNPGTFATAVKLGVPIIPIAIEYKYPQDAWVRKDESFFSHFINKTFCKKVTPIKMRYGQPMFYEDVDEFRDKVRQWIDQNILEMQAEFGGVNWPSTV